MEDNKQISNDSEKPLNFETDDFSSKDFIDYIEEPIGKKIKYFSVLISKKDRIKEPVMFWLNTSEKAWYRFFIDAWLAHWTEFNGSEKDEILEEDFEEHEDHEVRNLMEEFNLEDKILTELKVSRFFESQIFTSEIKISIENNLSIVLRDYGDEKPAELLFNYHNEK